MSIGNERRTGENDNEVELTDYLAVLWKYKWLIVAGTVICAIAAGIVAFNMTKIYEVLTCPH